MKRIIILTLLATVLSAGCVTKGEHERLLNELRDSKNQELSELKKGSDELASQLDQTGEKGRKCEADLTLSMDHNTSLVKKVQAMGGTVEELEDKMGQLSTQRAELVKEVEELRRMRAAAEKRAAEFKQVLAKLQSMISAGTLKVKIRNGAMVVEMSNDIMFPSGRTNLKEAGKQALFELAETLKGFTDRRFQVVGHTDPTPIRTERFPSNWELSTQRAIEVVKLMVEAGVPPTMITAAGHAEFDPIGTNESAEGRQANRRVEVIFLPKIDELPGFEEVGK